MIAAILDLHEGPRPLAESIDQMQRRLLDRHDVVDENFFLIEQPALQLPPRRSRRFLGIADHQVDRLQPGEGLRVDLGRAAGHDDSCRRMRAPRPADGLARLPLGLGRHRTGVEHQRVGEPLGLTHGLDRLGLVGIEPTAEIHHLEAGHCPVPAPGAAAAVPAVKSGTTPRPS